MMLPPQEPESDDSGSDGDRAASGDAEIQPEHLLDGYFSSELSKFLDAQTERIMELTVERYAVVLHDSQLASEFLTLANEDVRGVLRGVVKKARKEVLSQNQQDLEAAIRQLSRELIKEKENTTLVNRKMAVIVEDARRTKVQLSLLEGQLARRDSLLANQRLAFLKELSLLKESLWQMSHRGNSDVPPVTLRSWSDDPLAEEMLRDEKLRLERLIDEMREKFEREKDMIDVTRQREIEDLRKIIEEMESRKSAVRAAGVQTEISAFALLPSHDPGPADGTPRELPSASSSARQSLLSESDYTSASSRADSDYDLDSDEDEDEDESRRTSYALSMGSAATSVLTSDAILQLQSRSVSTEKPDKPERGKGRKKAGKHRPKVKASPTKHGTGKKQKRHQPISSPSASPKASGPASPSSGQKHKRRPAPAPSPVAVPA
eukprot:RCo047840